MGSVYTIFGRKVPAYQLSMGVFGLIGATVVYATSGSKKPAAGAAPAISAESSDEEKFIMDYLKKQESS